VLHGHGHRDVYDPPVSHSVPPGPT
jgi:hypothetical protein